jgi:hypothetical protein
MQTASLRARTRAIIRAAAVLCALVATAGSPAGAQQATVPAAPAFGSILGRVVDSLTSAIGLEGAEVYLAESPRVALTDAGGRFRLDSLAPGRYTIGFSHPTLDSLGIGVRPVTIVVGAGLPQQITLSTPSARTVARALCGAQVNDSTGALIGSVREAEKGAPVKGARVVLNWTNLVLGPSGAVRVPRSIVATADASGIFRACGVPTTSAVAIRATAPPAMGVTDVETGNGFVELGGGLGLRNLVISVIPAGRAAGGVARAGGAVLDVTVIRSNGTPIPGAQVSVAGDTVLAISGPEGRARLADAPLGTRAVEVRAIGFAPQLIAVDLRGGKTATAQVRLAASAQVLDTVRVVGLRGDKWSATGFDQRKALGQGYYLDRADIERRQAIRFTDLLRTVPGVTVGKGDQYGSTVLAMRGSSIAGCSPALYIDGIPFMSATSTEAGTGASRTVAGGLGPDDFLIPAQLEAIEIYPSTAGVPAQYSSNGGACGTILVWSRSSRPESAR